jgi:hypothetical protein
MKHAQDNDFGKMSGDQRLEWEEKGLCRDPLPVQYRSTC